MKQKDIQRILIAVLLVVEFCFMFLSVKSYTSKDIVEIQDVNKVDTNTFAMYVENEDTGEYDEVTNTNTFPEGYILNMDKTGCIDNKGNSISDILTSKDDKVMVKSNKTVFCYLYFDKDNRVYTQIKRDYKNSSGALLLSETESDEYPVYYYNGDITNNNILYANFCWKMVRTTETGGVKLIYNGVPDEGEDGTLTCDNTGEESQIGTSSFSSGAVGYMYNTHYQHYTKGTSAINVLIEELYPGSRYYYYYGDTATWDETEKVYKLSNSDGSEVTTFGYYDGDWRTNYQKTNRKYMCKEQGAASCGTVYYIVTSNNLSIFYYELVEGKAKDDPKIKLATSVTDNGDGTYTLVNPIEVIKADWNTNYANYKNYYYCGDLTSETCEDIHMSSSTNFHSIYGFSNYKYGNGVSYNNGEYTLVNTIEFFEWPSEYNTLNNNHYTCFNTSGVCENVNYIYAADSGKAYYITLSNGELVGDSLYKMLYADDVNKTDSTIKAYIDEWYEGAILNQTDGNGGLYSSYLENTIFCNNRETTNLNVSGWNPNGGDVAKTLYFNYSSLECTNKTDQFTLKVEVGGTEGYGNNALDYPIGMLSYKEVSLASSSGYLGNGVDYWLMSPSAMASGPYLVWHRYSSGAHTSVTYSKGVRPSISLSNKVEITGGNGSAATPYQIILSS